MSLFTFPPAPLPTQRAVNGSTGVPVGVRNESDVFSAATLLRLGIRNESRIDLRFANAGETLNTSTGDVVAVRTSTGATVFLLDVGNGGQNLQVIGHPGGASTSAVAEAVSGPQSETQASLAGVYAETHTSLIARRPVSGGSQAADAELVGESGGLDPSLTPGPGALGAAEAAVHQTIEEATPVYEPPPEPYYAPPPPEPYYEPPPAAPPPVTYEEYAATQDALEQLEVLYQQQYSGGPVV